MREGFAVAIREDALVRSPLEKVDPRELPKPGAKKKPRRLDDDEIERLLAAAKKKTPGYHALFVLLAFTGLRIREALGLTWRDVDLDAGVLRVEQQLGDDDRARLDVKTASAARELPLYPRLRRVLAAHKLATPWNAADDPVFATGRRKPKGYRNVLRALAAAVKEAKIEVAANERLSPHALRHTYTSHLIVGLELDAATTSKLAGHANPQVTMRVYADDFRKTSERNAAVLKRAAERGFGK
jgi:integrase